MLALSLSLAAAVSLSTTAERSGFTRTGSYDEVISLCHDVAAAYPDRAYCIDMGVTPQGRVMKALVLSDAKDPHARPAIVVQGGIHAGEIDGKDAGFLIVRELLENKLAPGVLGKLTFVFVPVFNVDGHERVSKNNRPNQRGPEAMGWRTTAQNLNLNRDYMKAEAPEMQAMLRLLAAWDPLLYVDLHVTDGAQFQHDVAVLVDPALQDGAALQSAARALQRHVVDTLNAHGHHALDFYPELEKDDDPASGFAAGVAPPRFSQPYWALRGHIGMLVETHSWKDYKTRVMTMRDILRIILAYAPAHLDEWRATAPPLAPGALVTLAWENTDEKKTIDFLGYRYTRTPSPISGALRTQYDERKPEVWRIPLLPSVKPAVQVAAPAAYVVPVEWAPIVLPKLAAHAIAFTRLANDRVLEDAQTFRATAAKAGDKPYEGRQTMKLTGAWAPEKRAVKKGSLVVPATSPLVVQLFEPQAPDALVTWGFMNAAFEQKEYMEGYVAEGVAEAMLKDKEIAAAFERALADPAFARDPEARLDFFYRRHPSWDERKDLYPVFRVNVLP